MLRIDKRELGGHLDVSTGYRAGTLDGNGRGRLGVVLGKGRENKALYVQDDIGDIFDNTLSGGELMLHAFDLNSGSLRTIERGQKARDACNCPAYIRNHAQAALR